MLANSFSPPSVTCVLYSFSDRRDLSPVNSFSPVSLAFVSPRSSDWIIHALGGALPALLPGYTVKILDGNALAGTDHRLQESRHTSAALLPGKSLVVLDPALMLAVDVFPCEDGHAQERSLLPAVLQTVQAGEAWIEDRNFCTSGFLFGIDNKQAYFLVREHKGLSWHAIGKLHYVGRTETGEVFEQTVRLEDGSGNILFLRRIVVHLDQPTRDRSQTLSGSSSGCLPLNAVDSL